MFCAGNSTMCTVCTLYVVRGLFCLSVCSSPRSASVESRRRVLSTMAQALLAAMTLAPLSFTPSPLARMPLLRNRQHSVSARLAQPQASLLPLQLLAVNDGESTRPARDLIENPAATAYLVVLAVLVGFLSFLAISDRQAKQRAKERAQRMEEDMQAVMATTQSLREQGKVEEANVLEGELKSMRRETKKFVASEAAKDAKPSGPAVLDRNSGNRYGRRAQETEQLLADSRLADENAPRPKKQLTGAARARAIARAKRKADKAK